MRFLTEFAFTLAGAVTVSGIIALTLSPMMTSRIFRAEQESGRFVRFIDRQFGRLRGGYQRVLASTLETWLVFVVMGLLLLGGTIYLYMTSKSELSPQEDQGIVLAQLLGPPNATPQQMKRRKAVDSCVSSIASSGVSVAATSVCSPVRSKPGSCSWSWGCSCSEARSTSTMTSKSELSPQEDQGIVLAQLLGPPNATPQQMSTYAQQVFEISHRLPEYDQLFQITGVPAVNQGIGGVLFKPWNERKRNALELQQEPQKDWNTIAGATVAAFQFPALPGARGLPLQS